MARSLGESLPGRSRPLARRRLVHARGKSGNRHSGRRSDEEDNGPQPRVLNTTVSGRLSKNLFYKFYEINHGL